MKPCPVSSIEPPEVPASRTCAACVNEGHSFDTALEAAALEHSGPQSSSAPQDRLVTKLPVLSFTESLKAPPSGMAVAAAYRRHDRQSAEPAQLNDYQKYIDDQLLRNPGGRNYYLDEKKVIDNAPKQSLWSLIRKDFSDALGNIKNFFGNLFLGTPVLYRSEENEIVQGWQKGLVGTMADFCKDIGSALTFGAWHPGSDQPPSGFKNRLLYSVSKLEDAFLGDILKGVPSSANHMGKNLALAGWHLVEVLPDALTGSFEPGQKLTTTIFDNGHVAVEYLTDIIPSGDAWLRVHASDWKELKLPVLYNIKMPEHHTGDVRWEFVRNTPFRKTIETIGSLLTDALAVGLIGHTGTTSNRRNQVDY